MQILEYSIAGTRSAVLRLQRRDSGLRFVVFPMIHVASPHFYAAVADRLRQCAWPLPVTWLPPPDGGMAHRPVRVRIRMASRSRCARSVRSAEARARCSGSRVSPAAVM
jgi:hypothetical protein